MTMAKKVLKKLEEDDEYRHFEFPPFDEAKFLAHEFEQTSATVIAFLLAIVLGVVSYLVTRTPLGALGGLGAAVVLIVTTPWIVQRLRPQSTEYTKGEWAALLLMEIFGWMGIWFLLSDLVR
ncbi:MAG: hypothetical protein L3K17_02820 [Thermoplasmata archaeon]|nr:hypothetical protein [Thermoplasmata archaeon]